MAIRTKNIDHDHTLELRDGKFAIVDGADLTKKLQFQCSGITTATTRTLTAPDADDTICGIAATQTLTNKTLTSPTITGATQSATIDGDIKRCSADTTATSSTTLANITGLTGFSLVAGATYNFEVDLQTNCSTNGGIGVAFKYTTLTLTSIQCAPQITAVAGTIGVARNTTTTDQTLFVNTKAAAYIQVRLTGTLVVNAAGTLAVQMAQESSHADTTTVYAGSTARFTRIA